MSIEEDPEYTKLKDSHKLFITQVMNGKNYTDAYALAFPKANRHTAQGKGSALYKKYKNLIDRNSPLTPDLIKAIANETIVTLKQMAFADVSDMIDKVTGKPLPLHKMPKAVRIGITEMNVKGNKYSYVIGGKLKAMELLAKITKLDEPVGTQVNISISEEERDARIQEILIKAVSRDEGDNED